MEPSSTRSAYVRFSSVEKKTYGPITTGAPSIRPSTDVLQSSSPVGRAKCPESSVEPAGEDAPVRDRGRRVAEPAHARMPHDAARGRVERVDGARACDRVEPRAVRRGARVEALVAERVALEVRRPLLFAGSSIEADERARICRHAHAAAEHRRARIDPAAGLIRPADAPGVRSHREQPPVVRAEEGRSVDDDRRRLDLASRANLPDLPSGSPAERRDGSVLRCDEDARPVDRRAGRERSADAPSPLDPTRCRIEGERRAGEAVDEELALAVDGRELDVRSETPRPREPTRRES